MVRRYYPFCKSYDLQGTATINGEPNGFRHPKSLTSCCLPKRTTLLIATCPNIFTVGSRITTWHLTTLFLCFPASLRASGSYGKQHYDSYSGRRSWISANYFAHRLCDTTLQCSASNLFPRISCPSRRRVPLVGFLYLCSAFHAPILSGLGCSLYSLLFPECVHYEEIIPLYRRQ